MAETHATRAARTKAIPRTWEIRKLMGSSAWFSIDFWDFPVWWLGKIVMASSKATYKLQQKSRLLTYFLNKEIYLPRGMGTWQTFRNLSLQLTRYWSWLVQICRVWLCLCQRTLRRHAGHCNFPTSFTCDSVENKLEWKVRLVYHCPCKLRLVFISLTELKFQQLWAHMSMIQCAIVLGQGHQACFEPDWHVSKSSIAGTTLAVS